MVSPADNQPLPNPSQDRKSTPLSATLSSTLAWGLVLLYAVVFSHKAILRHASFNSNAFDLGLFDQSVWNTLQGRIFFYTTTGEPLLHLSNHADFILLFLAPFYLIYNGPETLLILQATIIALGGLPLFWLAQKQLQSHFAALSLLIAYLLFPGLELVTLRDFHPPGLATGFLIFAFYCLVTARTAWFFTWATLAMMCKEQIPLLIVFMGLYALIMQRRWRIGLLAILYGLAWFGLVMGVVIPAYSITGESLFLDYYAYLGDSPSEIIFTTLTRPDIVLQSLWQPAKYRYFLDLMMPFGFLPLLGLPALLIGTPSFAINLLSTNPALHDTTVSHYIADVAPWVAWGAVYGLIYLTRGLTFHYPHYQAYVANLLSVILLGFAAVFHYANGHSRLAPQAEVWAVTQHDRLADRFIAQIPPEAPLSAQGVLYPHVSHRQIAYQFPHVFEANYIFLDAASTTWPMHPNDYKTAIERLLQTSEFGVLDAADGYLLLKRDHPSTEIPAAFYDFAYSETVMPDYPLQLEFDGELRLLGFDLQDAPRHRETIIRFYWQALTTIERDLKLYPFFLDEQGMVIAWIDERPLVSQVWLPPRRWWPHEIIVAETLPMDLEADIWSIGVGVLSGAEWQDWRNRLPISYFDSTAGLRAFENRTWARIGTFVRRKDGLATIPLNEVMPNVPNSMRVNFAQQMALIGYELTPLTDKAGQPWTVILYWEALQAMSRDYTVFVHLVDQTGQQVAQHDGMPFWQVTLPTSVWQPGEQLKDQHMLMLPAHLSPSDIYELRIGVYYWQTLERLPIVEADGIAPDYVAISGLKMQP